MMELTKNQKEVLDEVKLFIEKNGYAPTVRELCFLTDKSSPATIHYHLKHLKEKGYIDFDYNKNRTVRLINDNKDKVINDLLKRISNLEYELEKANNIINELEEYICAIEYDERHSDSWQIPVRIHNKLKELKGSDKNV